MPEQNSAILQALQRMNIIPKEFVFRSGQHYPIDTQNESHIQGIQTLLSAKGNEYFVLSTSNNPPSDPTGIIIIIDKSSAEVINTIEIAGFGHAGGIQVHDTTLIVPLARKPSPRPESEKKVRFYDLSDPLDPRLIHELPLQHSVSGQGPEVPFRDAQAAGFVKIDDQTFLVGVVISHTEVVFAYLDEQFHLASGQAWQISDLSSNGKYLWPQNINFYNTNGDLSFIGFLENNGKNLAELFTIKASSTGQVSLEGGYYKYLEGPANMRAAGGSSYRESPGSHGPQLEIVSFGRNIDRGISNFIGLYSELPPQH